MDECSAEWIRDGFVAYEALLGRWGGRYSIGDVLTLADVCLIPQIANARRYGVDMAPFARILAVEQATSALPAFAPPVRS